MPNLSVAYQWMINLCNAPNTGYSQTYRRGQVVNGITYYDCSSAQSAALTAGQFFASNPWFNTANMRSYLERAGFIEMDIATTTWMPGDIVWRTGHCEMVYQTVGQTGITMGAHTDEVPLADQVSINDYVSPVSEYSELWRYPGGAVELEWIKGNRYLNDEEMQNNAMVFYQVMANKDMTLNAIAGILGNIQIESTINPGCWQNLDEGNYSLGFGLFQATPATKMTNWLTSKGYNIDDGDGQCEWLDTYAISTGEWIPTADYPETYDEFKTSKESAEYLASVFLKNFERAGVEREQDRRDNASNWFVFLQNYPVTPDPSNPIPGWGTSLYNQYGAMAETMRRLRKWR